ncbi:MAG: MoaD/ThiS family protein [Candidatus Sericytochromatia bacterium]|nr:MoaD/ThiS family protein [Candidatus Sericytochromatia bacterium]
MTAGHPDHELEIRLFSLLREQVGASAVRVRVPAGTTVGALPRLLREAEPRLAPFLEVSRVAVNRTFAPAGQALMPGDEVALIPPVGGG